jgi:hypothetical protein
MVKRRTQAQTPAPKKDQVEGSKVNPKGSASGSRGGIEISDSSVKALENMRDKHNDRYKAKSKKVDLGTLKAVFRRGAGAFSVSHRPGMTRNQWALARVRTFLKLVGTGERKKSYTTDLDLLPKGHPQRSEADKRTELAPKKYDHIDFTPPKDVQEAAARALEVRASKPPSQKGLTAVGVARARDLANGRTVSPETAKRMLAYFTRHEIDKQSPKWDDWSKGRIAWGAWGGDPGYRWAKKIVNQMKRADEKMNTLRAYSEAGELELTRDDDERDDGLIVGRPFKTLALGQVTSRMNGENIGQEIDQNLLAEIVRVYNERREHDPVVIDWQHATSPFSGGTPAPPESGNALGLIIGLELRDDGLYAIPAYNERGLEVVTSAGGVLWSSPEFITGEVFSRDGGEKIGDAQLLAVTLTPRPAQSNNKIDRVLLNERVNMNIDEMSLDELKKALAAKDSLVKELEAQIADMKDEAEASMMSAQSDEDETKLAESKDEEKLAESKDEEKLAESKDEEKLAESKDEDEKKMMKMSEQLTESTLLSEVVALRESNARLSERLEKIESEKREIEKREAVNVLLRDGRITPEEIKVVGSAYELRELQPEFWQMFSERPANGAVNLATIGHGASGQEISKTTLKQEVQKIATERGVTFSEALETFRTENPDYYSQAYGA